MGEELNHGVFGYKVERKHTFAQVQAGVLHFRLENYMHALLCEWFRLKYALLCEECLCDYLKTVGILPTQQCSS